MKLGRFVGDLTLNYSTKLFTLPRGAPHKKWAGRTKISVFCIFLTNQSNYQKIFEMKIFYIFYKKDLLCFFIKLQQNTVIQQQSCKYVVTADVRKEKLLATKKKTRKIKKILNSIFLLLLLSIIVLQTLNK